MVHRHRYTSHDLLMDDAGAPARLHRTIEGFTGRKLSCEEVDRILDAVQKKHRQKLVIRLRINFDSGRVEELDCANLRPDCHDSAFLNGELEKAVKTLRFT